MADSQKTDSSKSQQGEDESLGCSCCDREITIGNSGLQRGDGTHCDVCLDPVCENCLCASSCVACGNMFVCKECMIMCSACSDSYCFGDDCKTEIDLRPAGHSPIEKIGKTYMCLECQN